MTKVRLFRMGSLIVLAQLVIAALGILGMRLFTDLMTPEAFGESSLVLSALALGLQLFVAGFTAAQLRFHSEAEALGNGDAFTRETMNLALRATALLAGTLLLALIPLRAYRDVSYSVAIVASGIAWLFMMTVRNVMMSRIQAQRRQSLYAGLQVAEGVLIFAATILALRILPSVGSFLIGQTIGITLLVAIILGIGAGKLGVLNGPGSPRRTFGARAWAYGAPFAPMSFLSWLANMGDRYTLAALLGAGPAGRYVAPFSIASRGMLLVNAALCDLFRPLLFDAENRHDQKAARQAFIRWVLSSLALSSVGFVVIYLGGSVIARLLLAPAYRAGAVDIMLWVSLGYTISGVTQVVETRLMSLGYSARLLLPMALGAVANIGFSIILVRSNGIVGAAQATCASFLFQNLTTVVFLLHAQRKRRGLNAPRSHIEPA